MASLYSQRATAITTPGVTPNFATNAITTVALDVTVTAVSGSGAITFFFERLGYDEAWYPCYESAAALSAPGTSSVFLGPGCAQSSGTGIPPGSNAVFTAQARLRWTLTGTSVTCSISIEGR
jgi:hypothetical protein